MSDFEAARVKKLTDSLKSKERIFLEMNIGKLDADTKQAMEAGNLQLAEADFYVRRRINAGGSTDVLDSTTVIAGALCKLDRNKVPELQSLVMSGIRFAYGNLAATATDQAAYNVAYSNLRADVPIALQNADFVMTVNDTPIFESRVSRFLVNTPSDKVQGVDDIVKLKTMKLLTPTQVLGIIIKLPPGVTLDSAKSHFIEVSLLGEYTRAMGSVGK